MEREAKDAGWEPEVREPLPDFPGQWGVICERHAVTSPDFVREADDSSKVSPTVTGPSTTAGRQALRRSGGLGRCRLGGRALDLDPR
jgi:hypothetical protein